MAERATGKWFSWREPVRFCGATKRRCSCTPENQTVLRSLIFKWNNSHNLCKHYQHLKQRPKILASFAYRVRPCLLPSTYALLFFLFHRHPEQSSADLSTLPVTHPACLGSLSIWMMDVSQWISAEDRSKERLFQTQKANLLHSIPGPLESPLALNDFDVYE